LDPGDTSVDGSQDQSLIADCPAMRAVHKKDIVDCGVLAPSIGPNVSPVFVGIAAPRKDPSRMEYERQHCDQQKMVAQHNGIEVGDMSRLSQ
jgi:hypothetical protein